MKKTFLVIASFLVILIAILLFNTITYDSPQQFQKPESIEVDPTFTRNLSDAIAIKTISYDDTSLLDTASFRRFILFLEERFPLTHRHLHKEVINDYSLLFKWEGKNNALKPAVLLAHLDVVPPEGKWTEGPFDGIVKDGYIWGRGSLDDKSSILAILESAEKLLKEKFVPERTLYFAFGHDEEVGGRRGARHLAERLKSQSVEAEFVLDEGLMVTQGIVPGIEKPVALIGTGEKGYLSVRLSVDMEGGHGSMPARENAIGAISKALLRLQDHPFPAEITQPVEEFLDHIGPEMPWPQRIVFANRWLFKGIVVGAYEKSASGNALVRHTLAPTIFKSGIKENVIPEEAYAVLNIRTLPTASHTMLIEKIPSIIMDDRIRIEVLSSNNPSAVSSIDSYGYKQVEKTIRQVFQQTYVAPSLMIAATDSKHYTDISQNIYRFLPVQLSKEDLPRIHGADERIKIDDYKKMICFYYLLMKNVQ